MKHHKFRKLHVASKTKFICKYLDIKVLKICENFLLKAMYTILKGVLIIGSVNTIASYINCNLIQVPITQIS